MLKRLTLSLGALVICGILIGTWLAPESTPANSSSGPDESEASDWPEFVLPLLKANALQELAGAAAAPYRDALDRADQRSERENLTEYVFHNRVTGDAEGPCTFRIIVDESRDCPTIVQSELRCPEW